MWDNNTSSWITLNSGMNSWATSLCGYGSDLIAGGHFTSPAQEIASLNGSTWSSLGTGINGMHINSLCMNDSRLYAGGWFNIAGGITVSGMARWDGTNWNDVNGGIGGSPSNFQVMSMAAINDDLYVGGLFTWAGGILANNIARYNCLSNTWSSLGTGTSIYVSSVCVFNQEVYIGGTFTSPTNYVAKWNETAGTWDALGTGTIGPITSLCEFNHELFAAGYDNNTYLPWIAKWDGSTWVYYCTGMNVIIYTICEYNNELYACGGFDIASGNPALRVAKWCPPQPEAGSDVAICNGANTQLSASGGTTYSWSPATGLDNPNSQNPIASPTSTTTYTVTIYSAYGCTSTDNVVVTVYPLPTAEAGNNAPICLGGSGVTLNASGGTSYSWSPATGLSATNIYNPIANPTATTTYTVTVTDAHGCSATDAVVVTVNSLPTANAGSDVNYCIGTPVQLSASGGTSYSWSPATGLSATNINNPTASPSVTTTYTVTVTDINGCSATDDVVVTVNPLPTVTYSVVDETCLGSYDGSIELTPDDGTPPYSYIWQNFPTNTTNLLEDLTAGTYYATVTDDAGCYVTLNADVTSINNNPWPYQPSNGTDKEIGTSVAVDINNGDVYAVGYFQGNISFGNTTYITNGGQDMYIVKFDKCGTVLWSKRIGGAGNDAVNKIIVDNSGNIIITGYFSQTVNFGGGNRTVIGYTTDLFVAKYDDAGNYIWDKPFDDLQHNNDAGNDLTLDGSGNIYVVGTMDNGVNDYDVYIAALDPTYGTTLWTPSYQHEDYSGGEDYGLGITYNSYNSTLLITGKKSGNIFVSKYDLNGNGIIVGNPIAAGAGESIIAGTANNIFLAGYTESGGIRSMYLAHVNSSTLALTTLFQTSSVNWDYFTDVAIDQNGNVFLAGLFSSSTITLPIMGNPTIYNNSGNGGADNFVVKYSPANNWFNWFTQSGSSVYPTDATNLGIALIGNGFGYVTGQFMGAAVFNNTTLYSYPYPTYPYTTDAYIARFQDLVNPGSYKSLVIQTSTSQNFENNDAVSVYPNPSTNSFIIDINFVAEKPTKIFLYNAIGTAIKEIINGFVQSQLITVDVKDLPTGNYFIRIETDKQVYIKKIIILKQE